MSCIIGHCKNPALQIKSYTFTSFGKKEEVIIKQYKLQMKYILFLGTFMHAVTIEASSYSKALLRLFFSDSSAFSFSLSSSLSLFSLCSYYGLTVWFPDMIKYLQKQDYASRTKFFAKEKIEHVTFNFTLENQVHRQGEYFNDK